MENLNSIHNHQETGDSIESPNEFGECILYFARETPELWLRQYFATNEELHTLRGQRFPDFYEGLRDLIFGFVNQDKVTRQLIIDFISHFQSEERDWNEQLNVIQVDN